MRAIGLIASASLAVVYAAGLIGPIGLIGSGVMAILALLLGDPKPKDDTPQITPKPESTKARESLQDRQTYEEIRDEHRQKEVDHDLLNPPNIDNIAAELERIRQRLRK